MTVACVNKAKTPLGVDFGKLTATLQKCYDQYFLPIWGYPLTLYNTANPKPSDWQFIYFDDADTTLAPDRAPDLRELAPRPANAVMRQDPLTGEWVSKTSDNGKTWEAYQAGPMTPYTNGIGRIAWSPASH